MSDKIKDQEGTKATPEDVENQEPTTPSAPDTSKMSVEELRSLVDTVLESKRKANAEAKSYRLKLEEINKANAAAEEKKLKEQKRYEDLYNQEKSKREALETQIRTGSIKSALLKEATKQGIIDPDGIDFIKIPDDFDVKDASKLVTDLKKSKTYLFKTENNPPTQPSAANLLGGQPPSNEPSKKPHTLEEYYKQNPNEIFGSKSV